jgi:copper(I)-binding protein
MMKAKERKLYRRTAAALCFAGFSLMALAAQDAAVTARDGWVRVPLPSKTDTALFVVLENHSAEKRKVVSVSSDAAASAEMHEMKMVKMTMVMTPLTEIPIPAKGKTSLNENGMHIMLFGLKTRPAVGDMINVTLKLDDGSTVPVTATVRK